MEGVGGLERLARKTKRPQACLAWCEALVERREWLAALRASAAASLPTDMRWSTPCRMAAEKRIEGILKESRRRYYGHAATLAACCLAVAPKDRQNGIADWIAQLQATYSRRHAFKDALEAAMNQR
jgi:hypothetical protein